jgi:hypothetical protein
MLPNPHDFPTGGFERLVIPSIPGYVAFKLGGPIVGVCPRGHPVDRAAMPEAAVDEHGDALGREDDVGPAADTWRPAVLEKPQAATVKS